MDTVNRIATVEHRDRVLNAEQLIPAGQSQIEATLDLSPSARGVVALLHAGSADRFASRNLFAARALQQVGLATLQADLLTPNEEAAGPQNICENTPLITQRILAVVDWLKGESTTANLPLGLLAGDRMLSALMAASTQRANRVDALVVHGDLLEATDSLLRHHQGKPTLLVVAGFDEPRLLARSAERASEFFIEHLVEHH